MCYCLETSAVLYVYRLYLGRFLVIKLFQTIEMQWRIVYIAYDKVVWCKELKFCILLANVISFDMIFLSVSQRWVFHTSVELSSN